MVQFTIRINPLLSVALRTKIVQDTMLVEIMLVLEIRWHFWA